MDAPLRELLPDISFGEPIGFERLKLIPLRRGRKSNLEYLVFDEILAAAKVRLEEVSAAGSVPTLRVCNRAKHRVFLVDGTTLVGCKQNRAVNVSIMLAPESETLIPVSCVEGGRWRSMSGAFSPTEHCDSSLRQMMCAGSSESLNTQGKVEVNQHAVWDHVEAALRGSGAASPTRAYQAAYDQRHEQLVEYESKLQYPAGATGVAVLIDDAIHEVELFDKPGTLEKLWPRRVRSYAFCAVWRTELRGRSREAASFFDQAVRSAWSEFAPIGEGRSLRFTAQEAIGAALLCDGDVVHMSLFAAV